jgi:hypothetical protein
MSEEQPINRRSSTDIQAILTILAKQSQISQEDANKLSGKNSDENKVDPPIESDSATDQSEGNLS